MPITLGEHTVQRSRASWHRDEEINRRQAALLAKDVLATREKLLRELLVQRFGEAVIKRKDLGKRLHLVDEGDVTWVSWCEPWQKRPEAVAVFTHPKTRTQGYHLICEWHWCPLNHDRN